MGLGQIKTSKGFVSSGSFNQLIEQLTKQRPQKIVKGLISQTGTAAPVTTILLNEIGGTIVWSRTSAGVYVGTLSGKFLTGKVWCSVTKPASSASDVSLGRATDNTISLGSTTGGTATDGLINNVSFSIEIWP